MSTIENNPESHKESASEENERVWWLKIIIRLDNNLDWIPVILQTNVTRLSGADSGINSPNRRPLLNNQNLIQAVHNCPSCCQKCIEEGFNI
jgi:hypothetical protein